MGGGNIGGNWIAMGIVSSNALVIENNRRLRINAREDYKVHMKIIEYMKVILNKEAIS
jgi:hypothetical protein